MKYPEVKCPQCAAELRADGGAVVCAAGCGFRVRNPFRTRLGWAPSGWCEVTDTAGRLTIVRDLDEARLRAALYVPGLQSAVRGSVELRLRRLSVQQIKTLLNARQLSLDEPGASG